MADSIIDIGMILKSQDIKDILISSILVKQSMKLGKIIAQVNEFLSSRKMFSFVCRIRALQESIYHITVYICWMMDHKYFPDNLVDLINYFILDSNAFNNVDWNKAVCNKGLNSESSSSNQEFKEHTLTIH